MEELSISWNELIHPDMDAIRRRDEFLNSNMCENIEFIDGEIHANARVGLVQRIEQGPSKP